MGNETQLARIGHRLARLYQIMQENRRLVDEERQELQALVSDISHQVKTPVSNLKMAADTLLDNAVKYTPTGRKIAVSVALWEMYVEIKVTDTGKGISESNQAAIFRRFYREEEVHEQQGVGIGLYLTREIVTRQGGYIKVVSEPCRGSEFSIMLPEVLTTATNSPSSTEKLMYINRFKTLSLVYHIHSPF